jgi:DNA helicase TIP49 (TBP-interacting protein)
LKKLTLEERLEMMVKAKAVTSGQVIAIKRQAAGKVTVVGKTGQVPVVITSEQAATLRKVSGSSGALHIKSYT